MRGREKNLKEGRRGENEFAIEFLVHKKTHLQLLRKGGRGHRQKWKKKG